MTPPEIDGLPNIGPKIVGTDLGRCIEQAFLQAHVPPFSDAPVTIHKTAHLQ
jgi:hypothetical protein